MTRSISELQTRRTICDLFIRALMKTDDPRAPDAVAHYRAQLRQLDLELTEALRLDRQAKGIPEPEPVVVGLQPAKVYGKAQ